MRLVITKLSSKSQITFVLQQVDRHIRNIRLSFTSKYLLKKKLGLATEILYKSTVTLLGFKWKLNRQRDDGEFVG